MNDFIDEGSFIDCDTDMPFYTPVPMWITLAKIPPQSKIAWTFLAEHTNVGRQMGVKRITAPKMETIAKALGTSRQRLRGFFDALEEIGALKITEFRYMGGMRRGYTYKVYSKVPEGYDGPTSLAEYYKGLGVTQFEWVQHRNEAAETAVSAGQPGRYQTAPTGGTQTDPADRHQTATADGDQKTPAIRKARRSKPLVGGNPVPPPPPPSSVGPGEDATPEAPLEEDEEMKGNNDNPSAEPRAHLPQEREGGEEESYADNEPQALPDGLVDIPGWLATLPGLGGAQRSLCGFLEYPVMQALAAGWTLEALAAYLAPKVDPDRAHNKNSIPIWYANHLKDLPAPPKAVVPLCDNPAHARNPKEDPVRGGCFWCNSAPKAGTIVQPEPLVDPIDMTTAVAACRKAITDRFTGPERSRNQMPHHRAKDEADRNRAKANDLLRGESGR